MAKPGDVVPWPHGEPMPMTQEHRPGVMVVFVDAGLMEWGSATGLVRSGDYLEVRDGLRVLAIFRLEDVRAAGEMGAMTQLYERGDASGG